jgi:hypothetical protein
LRLARGPADTRAAVYIKRNDFLHQKYAALARFRKRRYEGTVKQGNLQHNEPPVQTLSAIAARFWPQQLGLPLAAVHGRHAAQGPAPPPSLALRWSLQPAKIAAQARVRRTARC